MVRAMTRNDDVHTPAATHAVLFGGGGDLSMRMLLPALYHLCRDGLLPDGFGVIALARSSESREAFARRVREALEQRHGDSFDQPAFERFAARLDYLACDATDPEALKALGERLGDGARPLHFLATSPSLFAPITEAIGAAGLNGEGARLVIEKPVGRDLDTFRQTDARVRGVFGEAAVFRIDHYLGKETVQNLIALRFANAIFEPLWNSVSIDHVQITVAEAQGVGERWPYYDEYGALRDMVQNHMLQLLCLVAMEPPSSLEPDAVRNEKVKVLRCLRALQAGEARACSVRGQYVEGLVGAERADSYESERGQPSGTETFVALKAHVDNWRWAGVPFYLRTGKRLGDKRTEIVIQFRPVPHSIFEARGRGDMAANRLVIALQPDEDISLTLMNKAPSLERRMRLSRVELSLTRTLLAEAGGRRRIAYERLLLDAINGDSTLFVRADEAEAAWGWIDAVARAWAEAGLEPVPYAAGTSGPPQAFALMERDGREWHD
jgi:glucose-6-phosphate 1-dehydrogenase